MKTSKTVVLQVQVLKNPLFELSLPKGVYVIYECKQSALCYRLATPRIKYSGRYDKARLPLLLSAAS